MQNKKHKKKRKSIPVFKVGNNHEELRIQFNNFYSRYEKLKLEKSNAIDPVTIKKDIYKKLKIDEDFGLSGLPAPQLQYRVRKIKEILRNYRRQIKK
jgi:hypothetical protein